MRAWHVEAPGPVTGHPLRLSTADDVPEPGLGELLLRVLACGVCRTDLHVTEGDLPPHRPGVTPGHEVVGEVVAVGEGPAAAGGEPGGCRRATPTWSWLRCCARASSATTRCSGPSCRRAAASACTASAAARTWPPR